MIEATSKEMTPELKRWIDTWKSSLQEVLSQIAGQAIAMAISEEGLTALADDVWYTVTAAGAVSGELSLRLPAASASVLAKLLLGEVQPLPSELTAEHKEALEELLRQIAGHAATALTSSAGEVQFHVATSSAPSWASAATACFQRTGEAAPVFALEMQLSVALVAALSPKPDAQPAAPPAPPSNPQPAAAPLPANYERLMDIELEVKLRFGARRMELRDVLALSPGAVVELDRNLQAPVDLLLDGRVIALGDVVVVDGKYGLRITEVLDPGSAA